MTRNGRVRYELKTPWRNCTTHVIFEPLDFMFRTNGMSRAQEAHDCRDAGGRVTQEQLPRSGVCQIGRVLETNGMPRCAIVNLTQASHWQSNTRVSVRPATELPSAPRLQTNPDQGPLRPLLFPNTAQKYIKRMKHMKNRKKIKPQKAILVCSSQHICDSYAVHQRICESYIIINHMVFNRERVLPEDL